MRAVRRVISIHALREEGDRRRSASTIALKLFLSTPSARRATRFCWRPGGGPWHFYPRPPRGGRLEIARTPKNSIKFLSTPSARRATCRCPCCCCQTGYFYPRPPRGGRRGMRRGSPDLRNFYPRPPRGGRRKTFSTSIFTLSISIHALREEGDEQNTSVPYSTYLISIHALREEGDAQTPSTRRPTPTFLSTPSARRATTCRLFVQIL